MSRGKNWCFTINNPTDYHLPEQWGDVQYCLWQIEKGAQGTIHIQGFVQFKERKRMSQLKKVHATAHWEQMRGTAQEAATYCRKEDTRQEGPYEVGVLVEQGEDPAKRSRMDVVAARLKLKPNLEELKAVCDDEPGLVLLHGKAMRDFIRLQHTEVRNWTPNVTVIWGATGSGKSHAAFDRFPRAYWKPNGPWWDGYQYEDTVIWDDFDPNQTPYKDLLRILDWTPCLVPYKGGFVQLLAHNMVLTSTVEPERWYQWYGHPDCNGNVDPKILPTQTYDQLARRITTLEEMIRK